MNEWWHGGTAAVWGRFLYSWRVKRRPTSIGGWLRMWWSDFIVHVFWEGTEICDDCGRGYPYWRAPDDLWLTSRDMAAVPDCGLAPGLLCPACFADRMSRRGIVVMFIARAWIRDGVVDDSAAMP